MAVRVLVLALPGGGLRRVRQQLVRQRHDDHDDRLEVPARWPATTGARRSTSRAAKPNGGQKPPDSRSARTSTRSSSSRRTAAASRSASTRQLRRATAASLVKLAQERLLRRHDLPPHRARLRHPGRRPDADRHGRARATSTVDKPPADCDATRTGVVAMAKTRRRAARHLRQPVLRRHWPTTSACRPTTRSSARSRTGSTWSSGSASSATRTEQPTAGTS